MYQKHLWYNNLGITKIYMTLEKKIIIFATIWYPLYKKNNKIDISYKYKHTLMYKKEENILNGYKCWEHK